MLIGIVGLIGSGKDTVAQHLVDNHEWEINDVDIHEKWSAIECNKSTLLLLRFAPQEINGWH